MNFDERRYRPMRLLDLLDEALDLYKRTFALNLLIMAVIYLPLVYFFGHFIDQALRMLFSSLINDGFQSFFDHLFDPSEDYGKTAALVILSSNFMYCALCAAASMAYVEHRPSVRKSILTSLKFFLISSILTFIWFSLVIGGWTLCVVPGIAVFFLIVPFQCFIHAMIVEKQINPFKALARSWKLTAGFRMFLAGADILMTILSVGVGVALWAVLDQIANLSIGSAAHLIPALNSQPELSSTISESIDLLLMLPFNACVTTMLYFNLRILSEAFDMEILARRLNYLPDRPFFPPFAPETRRGRKKKTAK